MKDLSIVIVSYNTKKLLSSCITSILKNTQKLDYEIIVVDNASKDGSKEYIKELSKNKKFVKYVLNSKNLGFSKANNQGTKQSNSKYVLFLNSDTLIFDNVLSELVSWMDKSPKAGVVTCKLTNSDGSLQTRFAIYPPSQISCSN